MFKRRMMLGTSMMLALLLIAGGTFAWFTATAEEEAIVNAFTAGTLEIELVDEFDGAPNVNPGDCYDKIVYVKNLGTKRAFVRIPKDMSFDPELPLDVVRYELGENWVEHEGFFYYTEELPAFVEGEAAPQTTNLFAQIPCVEEGNEMEAKFFGMVQCPDCGTWYWKWKGHTCPDPEDPPVDPDPCMGNICFSGAGMGNEYQGAKFEIKINAEAVQVTNGAPVAVWGVNPLDM